MSSIVDHVSEFLQSVVDEAPSPEAARTGIDEAVQRVLPHETVLVQVANLIGNETFVGDLGGLSRTKDSGSGPSSTLPGFYVAYTEHGALYFDMDAEVYILVD
jgi:hypothetical protein